MKTDIQTRSDISKLVHEFYNTIKENETLGHIFQDIAHFSFETHIPVMIEFWQSVLFSEGNYRGNPILKHIELDKNFPLEKIHFDEWLKIFNHTVDTYFEGNTANTAKTRAKTMAELIAYKINVSKQTGFVQ